jgi:predicted RNase H-like HicB family nuclease
MKFFTAVIEKCRDTGLYVGYVPGLSGAHSQGESLDELNKNLQEVIEMLFEDGVPKFHFIKGEIFRRFYYGELLEILI